MSNRTASPSVCVKVVGSLNWDIINRVKSLNTRVQHNPIPPSKRIPPCPGGHGVNQAVAVYRASHQNPSHQSGFFHEKWSFPDVQVYLIGMIGTDDDERGERIKAALVKEGDNGGINVDGVRQAEELPNTRIPTGYAHIYVDTQGKPEIHNDEGANGELTWKVVMQELETGPRADLILIHLEIPLNTVVSTINYAKENKIPVIFNAAPVSSGPRLFEHESIYNVDHLILSHDCVETIFTTKAPPSEHPPDSILSIPEIQNRYLPKCNEFHKLGAGCVVITLGHRGVLASYLEPPDDYGNRGQRAFFCPARRRNPQVKDETGASDAFIGAYAVEILRQMTTRTSSSGSTALDIGTALEHGIKAGGLTTGEYGSFNAIPWRHEWIGEDIQWLTANPFNTSDGYTGDGTRL